MSDASYSLVRAVGRPIAWVTARPTVMHPERAARAGGYLLAANHLSPYDVPALIATAPRHLDFLSIVEMRDTPLVGRFFRAMNCTFLDRRRHDPTAARGVIDRLRAGRVVALFPEGHIRTPETSMLNGGPFNDNVMRLAQISGCPIVPAVLSGTAAYRRPTSYLPLRRVPVGIIYGNAIHVGEGRDRTAEAAALRVAFVELHRELAAGMSG